MAKREEGELFFPEASPGDTLTAYPFGLRNSVDVISSYVAQRMHPSNTNDEFMGMVDYASELVYDLLETDSEPLSGSPSSDESHHPSRESFVVEAHDSHTSSTEDAEGHPWGVPIRVPVEGVAASHPSTPAASVPPLQGRLQLEQLQARQQELDEVRQEVERERSQLEQEIERHRAEQGHARAMAHDIQ